MQAISTVWLGTLLVLLAGCSEPRSDALFEDVTELSGMVVERQSMVAPTLSLPAIMGTGVALLDADNDGDLDVVLVKGGQDAGTSTAFSQLWLNESDGDLRFTPGPRLPRSSQAGRLAGIAVADANRDGRLDVLITTTETDQLLLNTNEGWRSADTAVSSLAQWSASAVWFDANRDGWPDLYVTGVAAFDADVVCRSNTSLPDYCALTDYAPLSDRLFLNRGVDENGDGLTPRFEDVSRQWGLTRVQAPSVSMRILDVNGDDWPDVYVSHYGVDNALWVNRAGRGFENRAREYGLASGFVADQTRSVGVDAADLDRDGDMDLVVALDQGQSHQLLINEGNVFLPMAFGAGGVSVAQSGGGLALLDADADGWLDVYVANGAWRQQQRQLDASDTLPLRQSNGLFMGRGEAQGFRKAPEQIEPLTPRSDVSRGVAAGDLDNDGDLDLVITSDSGVQVLRNRTNPGQWVGVRLVSNSSSVISGARVRLLEPSASLAREYRPGHSYLSSGDSRLVFYRESAPAPADPVALVVEVVWPEGDREEFRLVSQPRYHTLIRGEGSP
ncbi:MAG: CRTAC1 family protein [Pseudomonadota bacterium]